MQVKISPQKCFLLSKKNSREQPLVFLELAHLAVHLEVPEERVIQASSKGYAIKTKFLVKATQLMVPVSFRKTTLVPKPDRKQRTQEVEILVPPVEITNLDLILKKRI
jgi:hypothetical protein